MHSASVSPSVKLGRGVGAGRFFPGTSVLGARSLSGQPWTDSLGTLCSSVGDEGQEGGGGERRKGEEREEEVGEEGRRSRRGKREEGEEEEEKDRREEREG